MDQGEHEALIEKALHFPEGLRGLPDLEHFVSVELCENGAFQQLQSLDDIEQAELELESANDAIRFVPVSFDSESHQVFLNLLSPFVVNAKTRVGRQLVFTGTDYSTRTPIELPVI